jgi:glycosyltransferase involved in cell wall biosynthesis
MATRGIENGGSHHGARALIGAPDITVVIPVWDAYVDRLPFALASVDRQRVPVAVVVVDNASAITVPEAPGAVTLRLPLRRSAGAARNAGLATVGTPLVCFLDADDELLPGTLERLRARLAAHQSSVASVAASVAWLEGSGETVAWRWPRPLAYRLCRHPRLFAAAASLRNQYPTTGAALLRTEAMREIRGFADADHEEDWLPGAALAARGRVDLDRRPGRRYRVSDRSLYGGGADLATMSAHRRALRRALRHDARTDVGWVTSGALAAFHLASAWLKVAPRRRGHAALLSASSPSRHAAHGSRQDAELTPR